MSKSMIILLVVVWLLCTIYFTLARSYSYPYAGVAMVGSWIASVLLLICIIIYIRKNKRQ